MKVDYVHKDTLTATDYVELNKNNELLISYNQALLKENQKLKDRDLIIAAELTKLQDENKQLKEELVSANESITWWNNRFNAVTRDNKHLKDNWNKLKDYIKETKLKEFEKSYGKRYGKTFTQAKLIVCNMILNKMQKLESENRNE